MRLLLHEVKGYDCKAITFRIQPLGRLMSELQEIDRLCFESAQLLWLAQGIPKEGIGSPVKRMLPFRVTKSAIDHCQLGLSKTFGPR